MLNDVLWGYTSIQYPSLQFLAKPYTDHEQGIVTGHAAASGSVADLFFGVSND